jgi:predicted PurR-regulated permease PerM
VVQFIENNILTPNITGSYVEINPLVIILSLIAGGMIWGLPGLFMIIPYLAILKIFCENITSLKPIGFLLSSRGTERYTINIRAIKRKFGWDEHSQ